MAKKSPLAQPSVFLADLLNARSPSGYEQEAQAVLDTHVKPCADRYDRDALGNRMATLHPGGDPILMLAGHMDELGLQIKHVDDRGFLYCDTIGGHDAIMIPGRRVTLLTAQGPIHGVTGKRAIHLMSAEDRKRVPEIHEMWIDIGASNKKDALKRVALGDAVVHDVGFQQIQGSIYTSRAFDDKTGCYVACEVLRRLARERRKLAAQVVAVATTQEEIGTRGAETATHRVRPHIGIAIDVGHATDHPDCDPRKHGSTKLGGGPILVRGANINPWVFERLHACATKHKIPFQVSSAPGATGTDARTMQLSRDGVATALIAIPLRYMHTPSEMADLQDIEHCVQLLCAFALSLKKGEHGLW